MVWARVKGFWPFVEPTGAQREATKIVEEDV
jgi:hypothetical protein